MTNAQNYLVWMDLEMTGLDPAVDTIIEMATLITDGDLNLIATGPEIAIYQPDEVLDNMSDWCIEHHGKSGLTQRVKDSQIDLAKAEQLTLEFIKEHVPEGSSPLCGNSIHQDRRFLQKYMTTLEAYLHYRNVDVSTIKELIKRWQPELLDGFSKKGSHLALDDIKESIDELKYYKGVAFNI